MLRQKVCMLGAYAVGKTSLVSRFVHRLFSDKYLSTVGVRIDKAVVETRSGPVELLLWDLEGDDELAPMRQSYLRGASALLLVADGTRPATVKALEVIHRNATAVLGGCPFIVLLNKADLASQWSVSDDELVALRARGWHLIETSAKTGAGVADAFAQLAAQLLARRA